MILDKIVADKKVRLAEQKAVISEDQMKQMALDSNRKSISFYDALAKEGLSIIGEFKQASPSMGVLDNKIPLEERIAQYNDSVDAISCLTEEDHFKGCAEDLKKVRNLTNLPIIRKDFIIDAYQIYEAKVIGADAILLIAAILEDEVIKQFYGLAHSLGLDVLFEVHDVAEMKRAIDLGVNIIGVNNRNLKDFSISLDTTKKLSKMLPGHTLFVSESGITKKEDIDFIADCPVNALLVGRALMESKQPKEVAREWKIIFAEKCRP